MKYDMMKLVGEERALIDNIIEEIIPKDNGSILNEAAWHHLDSGGKRIRYLLALVTCQLLEDERKNALPFAASCELLHNALLIHDDIEDGDTVRRGKSSVWSKYGTAHGINVGDFLAGKILECLLKSKECGLDDETILKLFRILAESINTAVQGQMMDIDFLNRKDVTENEYIDMVIKKTGSSFALPLIGGSIIAGKEEYIETFREFSRCIGHIFQIRDDMIDLTKGKGRREIGCDIKEGKRSFLVIHTASKCGEDERKKMYEILDRPREETTKEDISYVIGLFKKYESFGASDNKIEEFTKEGMKVIGNLPEELRGFLESFIEFVGNREV